MAKSYLNKCHTLMRNQCYDEDSNYHTTHDKLDRKTFNAHKYYKAPSCVVDTLSGGFLKSSLTVIVALIGLMALL